MSAETAREVLHRHGLPEVLTLHAAELAANTREAHPPTQAWKVESPQRGRWVGWGIDCFEQGQAEGYFDATVKARPERPFRLVRASTTYTVEAEHTPDNYEKEGP